MFTFSIYVIIRAPIVIGKGGYVFGSVGLSICLSVCLSVDNITLKKTL